MHEQGREAEGRVTRHWRTGDKDSQPMLAYEFDCEGQVWQGSSSAPARVWRGLPVGSPIAVRFLPSDPARNHPRAWEPSVLPPWFLLSSAGSWPHSEE